MQIKKLLYLGSQTVKKKKKIPFELIRYFKIFQGDFRQKERFRDNGRGSEDMFFFIKKNRFCLVKAKGMSQ